MKSFLRLLLAFVSTSYALFEEEAGQLDFHIATTGHGPVTIAHAIRNVVITSNPASCYVASRSIRDGSLLWRHNVCSSASGKGHAMAVGSKLVATLDDEEGILRAWDVENGLLAWDVVVSTKLGCTPRLGVATEGKEEYVVASCGGSSKSVLFNMETGALTPEKSVRIDDSKPITFCPEAKFLLTTEGSYLKVWDSSNGNQVSLALEWEASVESDPIALVTILSCSVAASQVLISTQRGTTKVISMDEQKNIATLWQTEDALSSVSVGSLVDASHYVGDEAASHDLLSLSNRLQSQWNAITSILTTERSDRRNHLFGFVKVAILLSASTNRIWALDTIDRKIRYQIDLPEANWHRLVHGGPGTGYHGDHGDYLALSNTGKEEMEWICWDGPTGKLLQKGTIKLSSPVTQIIPVETSSTNCRQGALVLTQDQSIYSIPTSDEVTFPKSGLYTHVVDTENSVKTFLLKGDSRITIGSTVFDGERIVSVAYPPRHETVQSPCSVMGDDSLLLKYLNPHLAVFITEKVSTDNKHDDEMVAAMYQGHRKPIGATDESDSLDVITNNAKPNLFVNVVDTVSGQILYRIGHANAVSLPKPQAVISENWIYYTYGNSKTRRSELGVLSLYEGMISSKGVTAFTSPEHSSSFSSLDARDSKPVVLSKLYSLGKPVSALGVTTSRSGISSRRLLLATVDGQITGVDRKLVDPRRPMGQLKESEKKEGLRPYSELIPIVSYMTINYNQTVESVHTMISAPTDLESQSLVLAFGGPDIFFARTSPARGFDLLPDSFNRPLLSLVVAALLVTVLVVNKMAAKKMKNQSWL